MVDLISRKAVIDALKVAYWDKDIQSAKDDPCIVDAMTDWAIRQVYELPSEQRWIPCNEKLPEEDTEVLVTRMFLGCESLGYMPPSTYVEIAKIIDGNWRADSGDYKLFPSRHTDPVAWMPLPEPYQEKEDKPKGTNVLYGSMYVYLLHKELGISLSKCKKAHDAAIEYLRDNAMLRG